MKKLIVAIVVIGLGSNIVINVSDKQTQDKQTQNVVKGVKVVTPKQFTNGKYIFKSSEAAPVKNDVSIDKQLIFNGKKWILKGGVM